VRCRCHGKAATEAAVQEVYRSPSRETRHAMDITASAASAAAVDSTEIIGPASNPSPPRATRCGAGMLRKSRQSITIDENLKMVEMKASGACRTWEDNKEAFPKSVSESVIRDEWRQRKTFRKRSGEDPGTTRRLRHSACADINQELRLWYNMCAELGAKSVPLTMAVMRRRAEEIVVNLGVTGISVSSSFVRLWAKRHNLVNISILSSGGSAAADVESSWKRMEEIRLQLEAYYQEQIFKMDETGI